MSKRSIPPFGTALLRAHLEGAEHAQKELANHKGHQKVDEGRDAVTGRARLQRQHLGGNEPRQMPPAVGEPGKIAGQLNLICFVHLIDAKACMLSSEERAWCVSP